MDWEVVRKRGESVLGTWLEKGKMIRRNRNWLSKIEGSIGLLCVTKLENVVLLIFSAYQSFILEDSSLYLLMPHRKNNSAKILWYVELTSSKQTENFCNSLSFNSQLLTNFIFIYNSASSSSHDFPYPKFVAYFFHWQWLLSY